MTRGPGWRKCTAYRRPGPRGTPLVLGLNEGLGSAAPDGHWRRARQRTSPLGDLRHTPATARSGLDRGTDYWSNFSRPIDRAKTMAATAPWAWSRPDAPKRHCEPMHCSAPVKGRGDGACSSRTNATGVCSLAGSPDRLGARGFDMLWLLNSRRQALTLLECRKVSPALPNVRAKRVTTAGRAGQQAQNGPKAQRLMAGVACRWRSA